MQKEFPVIVENENYNLVVVKRKKCRRYILRFKPKGRVFSVSIPYLASYSKGVEFFHLHNKWACVQVHKIKKLDFSNLKEINFKGDLYNVQYLENSKNKVDLDESNFTIIVNYKLVEDKSKVLLKFLRLQAKHYFEELSLIKAQQIGVSFNKIMISDNESKWGSCSSKGNLRYNFRLIMTPLFVIDYMMAHEVAHLKEFNHSKNFWSLVLDLTLYAESGRAWLKDNSLSLY